MSQWQPPAGWVEASSAVDGVQVWAPPPEVDDDAHARQDMSCPSCGAHATFSEKEQALQCPYCGYTASTGGRQVGRDADADEFTLETLEALKQDGFGVERRELHCSSCGADLAVEEGTIATTCPFCAAPGVNLREATHRAMRPRHLVPFAVDRAAIKPKAEAWLGKGWWHPGSLGQHARVDQFVGVYMPWWTFSARLGSAWEAEVGYERTERHYNSSTGSWETRTVIDWKWESGHVTIDQTDVLVAGTEQVSTRLMGRLSDFELGALAEYAPAYLAGWQAQHYDVALPDGWTRGKAIMREAARQACYADVPTHHVRNFSMSADFSDEKWRYVLLPVYVSAYRYGDDAYQVLVNGQTGTVAGRKPVAWLKVYVAMGAMLAPGLLLGLIGLPLLLLAGVGVVVLIIAFILLVLAGFGSVALYRHASELEAE